MTPVIIVANISSDFRKKFAMASMEYSGAQGKLNNEKNLNSKILCQTPVKTYIKLDKIIKISTSPRIFVKICNGLNEILRGPGKTE